MGLDFTAKGRVITVTDYTEAWPLTGYLGSLFRSGVLTAFAG